MGYMKQYSVSGGGAAAVGIVERPEAAANVIAQIARAAVTAGVQIKSFVYGDSVGDFLSEYFRAALVGQFGQTGWGGTALGLSASGGASVTAVASRYDVSMTGVVALIPAGGSVIASVGGGVRSFTAAAVWLETGPSMGTCKVEAVAADNTTVLATISSSTDCNSASQGFIRVAWTGSVTNAKLKVTGLTGNCTQIGQYFGGSSLSGVQNFAYTAGGISASYAGSVAFAALYDMVSYYVPNVCWYTNRESAAWVEAYNRPIIEQYRARAPNTAIIISGVWAVSGENTAGSTTSASYLESQALRAVADDVYGVFVDALKVFPTYDLIRVFDPTYDGVHIGLQCRYALFSHLAAATGLISVYGAKSPTDVSNTVTRSLNIAVTADPLGADALNIVSTNGSDANFKLRRWAFFQDNGGGYPDVARLFATSASGQALQINNAAAFAAAAGNYSADGQWVLVVHPTTGAATLWGRVGGVLKSLALGTLA